jgi:hypothetical protein
MANLYLWTNNLDYIVAGTQKEAIAAHLTFRGLTLDDTEPEDLVFEIVPDETLIVIRGEGNLAYKDIPEDATIDFEKSQIVATAKAWVKVRKTGLLCSIDY